MLPLFFYLAPSLSPPPLALHDFKPTSIVVSCGLTTAALSFDSEEEKEVGGAEGVCAHLYGYFDTCVVLPKTS